jgi:glycerol-3-phosphate dehydrogenase
MRLPLRPAALNRLRTTRAIDVLIVGGGINGAGLLRELALNGVDALLVDKADYAAGATSASSRMIHGGLRYLENGEFRLVRESLHERNRLLKNAPHAVKPLPTTIPIFSRWSGFANATAKFFDRTSKPSKRGAALVKIGLTLYDLFTARDRVLPTHSYAGRAAALRTRPLLHPGIVCTATYYDAWIPLPEGLCLELIDDALAAHLIATIKRLAENLAQELGCAVDYPWLTREFWRGCYEPDQLHNASYSVEVADNRLHRGERV